MSSSSENGSFFISGFKKFTHRSRHCLPFLSTVGFPVPPGFWRANSARFSFSISATWFQCFVPFSLMTFISSSSSFLTQLLFLIDSFFSWLKRYWHCESFLPGMKPAIYIQSFFPRCLGAFPIPLQYLLIAHIKSLYSSVLQVFFGW